LCIDLGVDTYIISAGNGLPELPTKRRHAEVSVHAPAALVPSAGIILISKLILAGIAGAVDARRSAARATVVACVLKRFTTNSKENTMSPQSEHDQSKKFADKGAAFANETLEKGKAAVEQSYAATVENIRDFNVKMIGAARANAEAGFDFALQVATAKSPSDIVELWTAHGRKQFEMLSEQSKELTEIGQKIAGESAEPFARGVNQAFKKAS
jgi:phasin